MTWTPCGGELMFMFPNRFIVAYGIYGWVNIWVCWTYGWDMGSNMSRRLSCFGWAGWVNVCGVSCWVWGWLFSPFFGGFVRPEPCFFFLNLLGFSSSSSLASLSSSDDSSSLLEDSFFFLCFHFFFYFSVGSFFSTIGFSAKIESFL